MPSAPASSPHLVPRVAPLSSGSDVRAVQAASQRGGRITPRGRGSAHSAEPMSSVVLPNLSSGSSFPAWHIQLPVLPPATSPSFVGPPPQENLLQLSKILVVLPAVLKSLSELSSSALNSCVLQTQACILTIPFSGFSALSTRRQQADDHCRRIPACRATQPAFTIFSKATVTIAM